MTALCMVGALAGPHWLRIPSAVVLVGFLPGAALTDAIFHSMTDFAERLLLAIGLSLAALILGAVALGAATGLNRQSLTLLLGGLALAASVLASFRFREQSDERGWVSRRPRLSSLGVTAAASAVAFAAVGWAVSYARAPVHATGVKGYSVLWIAPEGRTIHVAVRSQELRRERFRIVLESGARRQRWEAVLASGGRWERTVTRTSGAHVATASLYHRVGGAWAPYRHVRLVL